MIGQSSARTIFEPASVMEFGFKQSQTTCWTVQESRRLSNGNILETWDYFRLVIKGDVL